MTTCQDCHGYHEEGDREGPDAAGGERRYRERPHGQGNRRVRIQEGVQQTDKLGGTDSEGREADGATEIESRHHSLGTRDTCTVT